MKLARTLLPLALGSVLLVPSGTATASEPIVPPRPSGATTTDARGDVRFQVTGDETEKSLPAPKRTMGDIKRVRVTHTDKTVRVLVSFVNLNTVGTDHRHITQIRTPRRSFVVDIKANPGQWRGRATLFTGTGATVKCALSWKLDYAAESALVVVPRSCLSRPNWVQVGTGMVNSYGQKRYADDGLSGTAGSTLTLGPRLYP